MRETRSQIQGSPRSSSERLKPIPFALQISTAALATSKAIHVKRRRSVHAPPNKKRNPLIAILSCARRAPAGARAISASRPG